MLGIILLLLFLFSPVWAASRWAIKEKGSQTRRAGQGRAGRESVDALMMRLNQYKVDAGRWSGKKTKNLSPGTIPNPRISRILFLYVLYLYRPSSSALSSCFTPFFSPASLFALVEPFEYVCILNLARLWLCLCLQPRLGPGSHL